MVQEESNMKNNNEKNQSKCPQCNSTIPADAPSQLCPACVLNAVASSQINPSTNQNPNTPPSIQQLTPHFPGFEFEEIIGSGGMGAVYKAKQIQVDRTVSIKILSENFSEDPIFIERFEREARILGKLNHPNITAIFDFGVAGPYCYLLMEYVDGANLRQALETGNFSPSEALNIIQEICAALAYAHSKGILHRDIKPENILLDSKGHVKIADFGIAKLIGENQTNNITLTMQGSVLGSPHYMAPEQLETPDDVDQRADIYSLGVVFYEILTGELPLGRFPLPSQKANIDSRIDDIILRTLDRERQARYQNATEVITQVENIKNQPQDPNTKNNKPNSNQTENARFSLLAPILSGLSFTFLIATIYLSIALKTSFLKTILLIVSISLTSFCLIIGCLLAIRALSEIRKSNGQKNGTKGSIFSVTLFSTYITGAISAICISFTPVFIPIALIIWLITQALCARVLTRALSRWAKNTPPKNTEKTKPSIPKSLLLMLAFSALIPLSISLILFSVMSK